MKKKILLTLLALLVLYVVYTIYDMGVFRKIENTFDGTTVKVISLPGDEDITISYDDSFAIVSSTHRLVYPPTTNEEGNLYLIELKSGNFNTKVLKSNIQGSFAPHGISMKKTGDYYTIMAVNGKLGTPSIEVFHLLGEDSLVWIKSMSSPMMKCPNDVRIIDENKFYFTNDHYFPAGIMRKTEEFLGLAISGVVYYNGETYLDATDGIAYANGVNWDEKRKLVYVAASRDFLVKVYNINEDGTLNFVENIPVGTGVDNVELDNEGNIWVGGHPNLLKLGSYEKHSVEYAPSELLKVTYKAKGDYSIEHVFLSDGVTMSASTVASVFGPYILAGNLMDSKFLILKRN